MAATGELLTLPLSFSAETDFPMHPSYGGYYFAIAVIAANVSIIQSYYFSTTAEHMTRTLRLRTFSAIIRQDVRPCDRV